MSVTPYTQKRLHQHRGPQSSQDYNERLDENYRDFAFLYNALEQIKNEGKFAYSALFKQLYSMSEILDTFDERLLALERTDGVLTFATNEQIDIARFDGTPYQLVDEVDHLTWHPRFGALTLPYVANSSMSKIKYYNDDGSFALSNGLEVLVLPDNASTDDADAVVETSSPFDAIQARPGLVWERNVISNTADVSGAKCSLFIRIPNEMSVTANSNAILLHPFPMFGADILDISYSTDPSVALSNASDWTTLNVNDWYLNNAEAVGHVPPGAWTGDELLNSGPKMFYFEPKPIAAIRITLRQNSYYVRGGKYLYSYGLSDIDVRYDKFLPTGKSIIRLDAPPGETISAITSVEPKIWNVSQALLNDVFSYRVIWETSFNSGNYTLNPVASSQRVWLEVTLDQVVSGYTPVLSSLIANYT
jgi:hypothetical protein